MATRYIIGFKDDEEAKVLYFGPFVSESVADFFIAALPNPLKGGWVRAVPLQPFMAHEAHTVAAIIERNRLPADRKEVFRHHSRQLV